MRGFHVNRSALRHRRLTAALILATGPALIAAWMAPGARASRQGDRAASNDEVLWYRHPAKIWNEALPIGNGRLGAMVFGGVGEEHLQLNEDTVWAGQKLDRINPEAAGALPEVRRW